MDHEGRFQQIGTEICSPKDSECSFISPLSDCKMSAIYTAILLLSLQEIKELEAKAKQKAVEDLAEFTAGKDEVVAAAKRKLALVEAETRKQIAEVNEQAKADILDVQTTAELVAAKINAERDVKLAKIRESGS